MILFVEAVSNELVFSFGSSSPLRCERTLHIEIKPTVGDDYPAVLRQMRANGSWNLFLQDYVGTGATREQFIATFATAGIVVVFRDSVRVST